MRRPSAGPDRGLVVRGLTVRFGHVAAVDELDLVVAPGEAVALLGHNGAGKSTTLKVLAGVLPPTAGSVTVEGWDAAREPHGARFAVGYCPDVGGLVPQATVWEHLVLAASLRGLADWEPRAHELLDRFDLAGVANRPVGRFSHGMGRRTSVLLAAFHRPAVLLLDEPFDGVDPLGVEATLTTVAEAVAGGAAAVVSTHLVDLALSACPTAVVVRGGRVAARLDAADLQGPAGAARYRALLDGPSPW
ncbi:MAG: ecsA [Mycobacterium sp.]|jgi:ABC-2 type transport system ATP-binding protein|nr:ecsA [Mycobacterium sp.]